MNQFSSNIKQRDHILDVFRGLATLAVLVFHVASLYDLPLQQYLGVGRYGVSLFYMVSGAVIFMSLRRSEGRNLSGFYISRFFRIAPLFFITLTLFFFIRGEVYFLPYIFLGFADKTSFNLILGVEWSVYVEVLFYVLAPWLVLRSNNIVILVLTISLILAFSWRFYFFSELLVEESRQFLFFQPVNNLFPFFIGVLLWRSIEARKSDFIFSEEFWYSVFCLIGIFLLKIYLGDTFFLVGDISFTIFFVFLIRLAVTLPQNILFMQFSRLGMLSYSIYLLHYPLLGYFSENVFLGWKILDVALGVFMVLLVSSTSYHYIEKSGIRVGSQLKLKVTK